MAKANDVRIKPIPITLDKPRTLYFDFNAFIELEELYGDIKTALEGVEDLKLRPVRDMIWAGLLHEDENLTRKQVGKMLHPNNIEEIALKIAEGIGISLPEPEEGKPGE